MNKIIKPFKNKKFKYGTYSTLISVIIILILIFVNLIVGKFNISFDLTSDTKFSISDATKEILKNIDKDINIYALYNPDQSDLMVEHILKQYKSNSNKINIIYKDPYLYPTFAEKYNTEENTVQNGSIIIESSSKFKIINPNEFYSYDMSYTSQGDVTSIEIEPKITNAIQYVISDNNPYIYFLTGHGEYQIPQSLENKLKQSNYEVSELNLLTLNSIPKDCTALIMTAPIKDYSNEETQKIKDYLLDGGRAVIFSNYTLEEQPNFNSIINLYGIEIDKSVIIEGNSSYSIPSDPSMILPELLNHEITNSILSKGYGVLMPLSQSVKETEVKKSSITVEPLLSTSNQAYSKSDVESASINKEENDQSGPFYTALAAVDSNYTDDKQTTSKIVVIGSSLMLIDEIDRLVLNTNSEFIMNCLNWLNDSNSNTFIPSKSLMPEMLMINGRQASQIIFISCAVIPLTIFSVGFFIWLRRKNK